MRTVYRDIDALGMAGISKLGDFFMEKPENWVAIDFSDWSGRRKELFNQIRKAILNHLVIRFDYYGQYGDMSRRCVEPVQLLFKDYTWYLRAFCKTRQDMRLFKALRMKRVEVSDEIFATRILDEQDRIPEDLRLMEGSQPYMDSGDDEDGAALPNGHVHPAPPPQQMSALHNAVLAGIRKRRITKWKQRWKGKQK